MSTNKHLWTTAGSALYGVVTAAGATDEWNTAERGGTEPAVNPLALGLFTADGDGIIIESPTLEGLRGFARQVAEHVESRDGTLQARLSARTALAAFLDKLDQLREQIQEAQERSRSDLHELEEREPALMQAIADAAQTLLKNP